MNASNPAIEARDLVKYFGDTRAVDSAINQAKAAASKAMFHLRGE